MGAGDGTGSAIATAFAEEGFRVVASRRPRNLSKLVSLVEDINRRGGTGYAMPCDARDEGAVIKLFDEIERDVGPLEVVVFNIGANVCFDKIQTTARVYKKVWEMAAFAGFLTGREAARRMKPRGTGTIIFTGATASLRGSAGISAFSGAKHALRALAQSMARELGHKNIHVAHVIIDGAIDTNFTRENIRNIDVLRKKDAILAPADIARNFVMLHHQNRTAWTHELDLRPWAEKW